MNNLLLKSQTSIKGVVIVVLMMLVNNGIAKSYSWDNISQQQYIDNLVACEIQLQEYKWSKNKWPKANKTPKPAFNTVKDTDKIRQKVLENLYKQNLLTTQFNFDINQAMLQHDLDRMAHNTKDAQGLKAMYALFDNDAMTIAQCISRPYLVNKKLQNRYNQSTDIHQTTKIQAQLELTDYLTNNKTELATAQINTVTFKIKQEEKELDNLAGPSEEIVIELDQQQYQQKLKELVNTNLQEKPHGFIYIEILQQTDDSIKVKNLLWQKKVIKHWLKTQEKIIQVASYNNFTLTTITGLSKPFDIKAGAVTADTWKIQAPAQAYPGARIRYHTAVWTGTEMIVWGGYDGSSIFVNTGYRYNPSSNSWNATSTSGAPTARSHHTAVWTGTEMIVWGGFGGGNTGGRYNPSSDSWSITSTSGAPTARVRHTAVWTGTEMIVWGGGSNTGGRYDPSSDSWSATSISGAPTARDQHTAVWTGTEMIIWGGNSNTGGRYNPSSDSWSATSISGAPTARARHTAVWTGAEMIVWGGNSNTGGRYNPSSDSWSASSISGAPTARDRHTAVWTGSEMIVWGGQPSAGGFLNTGGRYNPSSDSWAATSTSGAPTKRYFHTVIWTGTEMIVWGGTRGDAQGLYALDTGGRYNPGSDNWTATSNNEAPVARKSHTAVWTGTEMIVWGGQPHGGGYLNTGGRYNPSTDSWIATSAHPVLASLRYNHTAVWTGTEMIIWGGYSAGTINTGGRYNPNDDSWSATSIIGVPTARTEHTAVWTGTEMIVWGGAGGVPTSYLNTGGRYNPSSDSWSATSTSGAPTARSQHTAVWTGTEMIVWGGFNYSNTGGRYNPSSDSWSATSTSGVISRKNSTAVWTGTEMIVWGGFGFGGNTGGRYNPSSDSWSATSTSGAPTARDQHTAVWTGTEMIVWGGNSNTGGRYNPSSDSWSATSTNGAPTGRSRHTAVWTGTEMIVWGGYDASNFLNLNSIGNYYPTSSYSIGGNLTGLNGNQVILQNNGGDDLTLSADGSFTFANAITEGGSYDLTVLTNPTNPVQICSVTNGAGMNIMANVTNVQVVCVNRHTIAVTVTGLDATNSIEVTTNGQSLNFTGPGGPTNFATPIFEGVVYAVQVTANPILPTQTCLVTGGANGDGSGVMGTVDVAVMIYCNTELTAVNDVYTAFEDITLVANDANGSVIGVNDDGVLVNDSDVDGDILSVVNPGTFSATGLTGDVTIASNGTFSYLPPANASGQDVLAIQVTDGIHSVASNITIDVLPVNDAPTFTIMGNVLSAELHPNIVNTTLNIAQFATNIDTGAPDENTQTLQFNASIFADSNSVLVANGASVTNTGDLSLDFTGNIGIAIIQLTLQDDGLTTNGGEDTSVVTEFVVSYSDVVFSDGFESALLLKTQGLFASKIQQISTKNSVIYQEETDSVKFLGHQLHLNGMDRVKALGLVKSWMQVLLLIQQTPT